MNFEKLYNKSKYLSTIQKERKAKKGKRKRGIAKAKGKDSGDDKGKGDDKKDSKQDSKDNKKDSKDKNEKGDQKAKDKELLAAAKKEKEKEEKAKRKKKKKNDEGSTIERILIRPLLLLRKARMSYTQTYSTVIPGFMPSTEFLGLSDGFDAPGWEFVAGLQPDINPNGGPNGNDYLQRADAKGWMSEDIFMNQQVIQNYTEGIDANVSIEPFRDFRIDLDVTRTITENQSLYFRDTTFNVEDDLVHTTPLIFSNFYF